MYDPLPEDGRLVLVEIGVAGVNRRDLVLAESQGRGRQAGLSCSKRDLADSGGPVFESDGSAGCADEGEGGRDGRGEGHGLAEVRGISGTSGGDFGTAGVKQHRHGVAWAGKQQV